MRTTVHEPGDHSAYSQSVLYWCGPDSSWGRPLGENEGGLVPVADGWVCGTGRLNDRPALFLLKRGSRVVVPTTGHVIDRPVTYVR